MRRRQFLAALSVAGLGALAGCGRPGGSISLADVSADTALADQWSQRAENFPDPVRELIAGAVADDPNRATTTDNRPPIEPTRPVGYEGRYYTVTYTVENERTETQYVIEATYNPDPPPTRTVAFGDLPAVDQEKLDGLLSPDREFPDGQETLGAGVVYTDSEEQDSAIVPEPEYDGITRGDRTVGLAVPDSQEVTIADYRYRATLLAEDDAELAALARERYRFQFESLTEDQRSILDTAKNDQARSADPPSQAFATLVEKFKSHEGIEMTEYDGTWLLRYDGRDWWANVTFPESAPDGG